MKTLQYLFFGAMAMLLMAADCSNKDSEFYNDVFISVPNLVDIENDNIYDVGDPVVISSSFERWVDEQGQNTPLDVLQTTGGARSFSFSYLIEKQNDSDEWEPVYINESDIVHDLGTPTCFGDFVLAQAVYNDGAEAYFYRGGVVMQNAGEYRLRFTYNSITPNVLLLVSDSLENNLFVNIYSNCPDTDGSGYYYFTVN